MTNGRTTRRGGRRWSRRTKTCGSKCHESRPKSPQIEVNVIRRVSFLTFRSVGVVGAAVVVIHHSGPRSRRSFPTLVITYHQNTHWKHTGPASSRTSSRVTYSLEILSRLENHYILRLGQFSIKVRIQNRNLANATFLAFLQNLSFRNRVLL